MLEDVLKKYDGEEVIAMDVYRDVFRLGDGRIQKKNEPKGKYKANPIGYYRKKGESKGHYRIFFEDTFEETLKEMQEADFAILNGITYFGRKNVQVHASKMYALIFDLDGVTDESLNNFFNAASPNRGASTYSHYPLPNYVILSGHGLHLYYVFDEPIALFPYTKIQLKEIKYILTRSMWNPYTSTDKNPQYQGINQGFRVIGGKTKIEGTRVRAFRMRKEKTTIAYLNGYMRGDWEKHRIDEKKLFKESKYTLEEAQKKFPEWYDRVILQKDKGIRRWKIEEKVHGKNPYALYDWWKRNMEKAHYGARYFYIMCLVIYGVKCGKTREEVRQDALEMMPDLTDLKPEYPFTKEDIEAALDCFDERYCTFPICDMEKISGILIPRNKRNGRTREKHLQGARAIRDINNENWRQGNGRPSKGEMVLRWRLYHPRGKKADCIRDTGLSKPTVYKWWDYEDAQEMLAFVQRWRVEHPEGDVEACVSATGLPRETIYKWWGALNEALQIVADERTEDMNGARSGA